MKPRTSYVWKYFISIDDSSAKCRLCDKVYSRKGRGTTALKSHLKSMHFEKFYKSEKNIDVKNSLGKQIQQRPIRGIKPVNRKEDSNKIHRENKQIGKTAETITPLPCLSTSNIKNEDEFDTFGKYIATSLRSMPQEFSIIAKTELQKAISDIQLKIVRQMNAGGDHLNRSQSPCGSASTSSDYENQHTGSPMSDSCMSTIKIEYDN